MLGIEGEAPASYNSLNDTNYLEQLVEGDADILLAYAELDKLDNLGLAYIPLIRSPFVAMVSMDSPLASMKSVTMDDLRSYRFVKFADGYSLPTSNASAKSTATRPAPGRYSGAPT